MHFRACSVSLLISAAVLLSSAAFAAVPCKPAEPVQYKLMGPKDRSVTLAVPGNQLTSPPLESKASSLLQITTTLPDFKPVCEVADTSHSPLEIRYLLMQKEALKIENDRKPDLSKFPVDKGKDANGFKILGQAEPTFSKTTPEQQKRQRDLNGKVKLEEKTIYTMHIAPAGALGPDEKRISCSEISKWEEGNDVWQPDSNSCSFSYFQDELLVLIRVNKDQIANIKTIFTGVQNFTNTLLGKPAPAE